MKAICYGSLNIDYTYDVPHFVTVGETISSTALGVYTGGKGLNQAVALSRAGLDTYMAGAIGKERGAGGRSRPEIRIITAEGYKENGNKKPQAEDYSARQGSTAPAANQKQKRKRNGRRTDEQSICLLSGREA